MERDARTHTDNYRGFVVEYIAQMDGYVQSQRRSIAGTLCTGTRTRGPVQFLKRACPSGTAPEIAQLWPRREFSLVCVAGTALL
jgi:hypothetical protein